MNIHKDHVLHSRNGKFEQNTSQVADVVRILESDQAAASAHGLVIHFHGGLNNHNNALAIADNLAPKYLEAGGLSTLLRLGIWAN